MTTLEQPLVKAVGAKAAKRLAALDLETAGDLLRFRVRRVEDSAAVVGKRLENLLGRGDVRGHRLDSAGRRVRRGPRREDDDREQLTRGRDGPLHDGAAQLELLSNVIRRPVAPLTVSAIQAVRPHT